MSCNCQGNNYESNTSYEINEARFYPSSVRNETYPNHEVDINTLPLEQDNLFTIQTNTEEEQPKLEIDKEYEVSGTGVLVIQDDNELIHYKGKIYNDKMDGMGTLYNKSQSYCGEFKFNMKHGKGTFINIETEYEYEGDWVLNSRQGYGIEKLKNREVYKGEFKRNKRNGRGYLVFLNGRFYIGEFKDGKLSGHGKLQWDEANYYEGDFRKNKFYGLGVIVRPSSIYCGKFQNDSMHGLGISYKRRNKEILVGQWSRNKLFGYAIKYEFNEDEIKEYAFNQALIISYERFDRAAQSEKLNKDDIDKEIVDLLEGFYIENFQLFASYLGKRIDN